MSQQQKQQQFGNEDKEDTRAIAMEDSEWSVSVSVEEENIVGHGNAKQKEESHSKIALLEARNQILERKLENLESKLENLELKAQIRAMTEEANLNKLKEENKAIRARMEADEEKAQMAKNEFESTIEEIRQKMEESAKEMAIQKMEHQRKMQDLEGKNGHFEKVLEGMELKCKMDKNEFETTINEIRQKMDESGTEMAIYYDEQLKRQKTDLEAKMFKEMATLKELLNSQGINLNRMDIPWTDLIKGKKLANPPTGNRWENKTGIFVSEDGLSATNFKKHYAYIFAAWEFCVSVEDCRKDNFAGLIIYYFEVTQMSSKPSGKQFCVGLSNGNIPAVSNAKNTPNCYAIWAGEDCCFLSGKVHDFKWPNGTTKTEWNGQGDVIGCGILICPENKVSIFFTLNGILLGKKIPIDHPGDSLIPTVRLCDASVEANFGGNSAKPFSYDIDKCPGLEEE